MKPSSSYLYLRPALAAAAACLPPVVSAQEGAGLNACLDAADLDYVDADSSGWNQAIRPYNQRLPVTPRAVVYATETEHIQEAVICAADAGIKVAAKNGGHSYGAFGFGGEDGHLVIQLDRMFGVNLQDDNTAVIQGGSRLGYVALELFDQGRRGISHGTCPSVGISGHVLHGGFGFSSHTHGLALDGMVGANVVLADGSLVHASEDENSDLFWALRGAGPSFGIVVDFEYETFAVPEQATWISAVANFASGDKEQAVSSLMAFQELLEEEGIAPNLNMRVALGGGSAQTVEAVYHGSAEDARAALEPLVEPLMLDLDSSRTRVVEGDWIDQLEHWAFGEGLNITYPYEGQDNAYGSSLTATHIPEDAMAAFVDYWFDVGRGQGSPSWWIQMDVHGDAQSGISAISEDATSYAHRDKLWLFQFGAPLFFGNAANSMDFLNGFMDSLKDNLDAGDWGRYSNYADSELSREEAQEQYYSVHLERLRAIKAEVDPDELFSNPQSINAAA